jgi:hypothetical protein
MQAGGRLRRCVLLVAALGLGAAAASLLGANVAPSALALERLDGTRVRPFSQSRAAWVFVFTRSDCPVAARYAPELLRLERRLESSGMAFSLVFVDPSEPAASIRAYLRDYGYADVALRDSGHELVRLTGATTTPEAAVFVPAADGPALVYRGRIDDRYVDIGRARPAATRHDLDDVVSAIQAGQRPPFRSTPAVGCLIADVTR